MMNRKALLICLFALFVSAVAAAEGWGVDDHIDAITDKRKITAYVFNDKGHSLSIYRLKGRIWANFNLGPSNLDILGDRLPVYRVDKNKPHDMTFIRDLEKLSPEKMLDMQPKWVNWRIHHGGQEMPDKGPLYELIKGQSVAFRYYLFTGGHRETSFTLSGADDAIRKVFAAK